MPKQTYTDRQFQRVDLHYDDDRPDQFVSQTSEELPRLLAHCKASREVSRRFAEPMRPIAEVPMAVYQQSLIEEWGPKEWRQWANDPANAPFRLTEGRM